jgi:protein gp37
MAKNSGIEWTDHTFNPWWGCVRVSAGCVHCYAETFSKRTGNDVWGVDTPRRFFKDKHWDEPLKWNAQAEKAGKPAFVFCASMADWLEDREDLIEPRARLCKLIEDTPWLTWLLLTKRIENIWKLAPEHWTEPGGAPKNAWFGVTTEDQESYDKRIVELLSVRAFSDAPIWLSIEPQIGPIDLRGINVDWAIVGGESGYGARVWEERWGRSLLQQCRELGIKFFLKQLGGFPDKKHDMSQFPEDLRVRDFPKNDPIGEPNA